MNDLAYARALETVYRLAHNPRRGLDAARAGLALYLAAHDYRDGTCPRCEGRGHVVWPGYSDLQAQCGICNGRGSIGIRGPRVEDWIEGAA